MINRSSNKHTIRKRQCLRDDSTIRYIVIVFLAATTAFFASALADPLGTEFTYQGELQYQGSPANGAFDFVFDLYDDGTEGAAVAGPLLLEDVIVQDGVFTVELDFGPIAQKDVQLWLGISVGPAGAGTLAELEPRQKISTVPFATLAQFVPMHSIGAAEVDAADIQLRIGTGCPSGQLVQAIEQSGDVVCAPDELGPVYSAGNGIAIADNTIHAIDVDYTNELQKLAINGNDLSITNGNTVTLPISPGPWKFNGPNIYYNTGNVGINVTNPAEKLHMYGGEALFEWYSGKLYISTPGSWPGFIGYEQSGKRRDIAFRDLGLHLGASTSSSGIANDNGIWIRDGGNVGVRTHNPGGYPLLVREPGNFGLGIQHSNGQIWELYVNSTADLILNRQGPTFRGLFSAANGVYTPASDKRLKKNIQPLPDVLDQLLDLKPSSYVMIDDELNRNQIGLIAQDVGLIFPELVTQAKNDQSDESFYGLNYFGITTITVKAIQEQQETIELQKESLRSQEARIRMLEERLDELARQLK